MEQLHPREDHEFDGQGDDGNGKEQMDDPELPPVKVVGEPKGGEERQQE